jgi:hypothetical protein
MPLVKTTLRAEPIEVDDTEVVMLRGSGLLEAVLDEPGQETPPVAPRSKPAPAGDRTETGDKETSE